MRADTLRGLAARYRSLALLYPTGGWDIAAEKCEQQARETEAEWAAQDAKTLVDMEDLDV